MHLSECLLASSVPAFLRSHITIRHPGYIRGEDSIFAFPRLDTVDSEDVTDKDMTAEGAAQETEHGVHFGTILVACQIVTGNSFRDAFLSYDRKGHHKVDISLTGILVKNHYYLHVPQGI